VDGEAVALSGGQRTAWRVGPLVLKAADADAETLAWQEDVLTPLVGRADFRVAPPVRSATGALVVDGWTGWRFEPGRHVVGRWLDIIAVGADFHSAVADVPRPAFLDRRRDPWAVADRVAWGELPATPYLDVPHVARLVAALRPLDAPPQLVHGDLTGNVLFAEGLPPLVLDLSPYWRPAPAAAAVVVADALVHEHADAGLVQAAAAEPDFGQYLLRALIFRLVTQAQSAVGEEQVDLEPRREIIELVLDLARHGLGERDVLMDRVDP
jgi:uncharacterized protein (TIGR02569 family)